MMPRLFQAVFKIIPKGMREITRPLLSGLFSLLLP